MGCKDVGAESRRRTPDVHVVWGCCRVIDGFVPSFGGLEDLLVVDIIPIIMVG